MILTKKLVLQNDIEQECLENILAMTIFVFLTLNTVSSAQEEIFGAKISSYERLRLYCSYTVSSTVGGWRDVNHWCVKVAVLGCYSGTIAV